MHRSRVYLRAFELLKFAVNSCTNSRKSNKRIKGEATLYLYHAWAMHALCSHTKTLAFDASLTDHRQFPPPLVSYNPAFAVMARRAACPRSATRPASTARA